MALDAPRYGEDRWVLVVVTVLLGGTGAGCCVVTRSVVVVLTVSVGPHATMRLAAPRANTSAN